MQYVLVLVVLLTLLLINSQGSWRLKLCCWQLGMGDSSKQKLASVGHSSS